MFNLFKTQPQTQPQTQTDLKNFLFSICVGSIEKCGETAMKLFNEGVSSFEDLRRVSEQDSRGILSKIGLNKIQENKIIGAIQGILCQIVEPPNVQKPDMKVLANSLFSIGVDSSMTKCESVSSRLFDQGIYRLGNLSNLSEQESLSILSNLYSINKSQADIIMSAIQKIPRKSVKLPKDEERTCFLLDSSGSVQNETNYFKKLKEIISESDESDLYVRWDSIAQCLSKLDIDFWIDSKKGFRGTNPISSVSSFMEASLHT
jgi:hypothetical protein